MMMHGDDHSTPSRKSGSAASDRLTVTLDAGDRVELERLAREQDRSLGWIVREALRQYLGKAGAPKHGGEEAE